MATTTFRDLIAENKRNSALLIAIMVLFTFVTAMVLSLGILAYIDWHLVAGVHWLRSVWIGGIAVCIALPLCMLSYYEGDRLVLALNGARRIQHDDDPELFNVVEEMAIAAGVPMPAVYLISDPALNAFATGRDPEHAAVAITSGLRTLLSRAELQGVLAHEMSHIRNYDTRLMLLMAVLIGTIVMLADAFWQMVQVGMSGSSRSSGGSNEGEGLGKGVLLLIIVAIPLAILAPLLAQMIQFAVSRQREYLADATAIELTRYPAGLAGTLRKIAADEHVLRSANRGTAHLFIANPIKKFARMAHSPFASHPPIAERIARIEALSREKSPAAIS